MAKIRILVVDDAIVVRRMMKSIIERDSELEVVGVAQNGKIALSKIPQLNPDIITLDIEMPEMDGISALREIRKIDRSIPVIMLSSLTKSGAKKTLEALSAGATDYLAKPSNLSDFDAAIKSLEEQLIPKLKAYRKNAAPSPAARPAAEPAPKPPCPNESSEPCHALCIGTSTGGPNALETLFSRLETRLPVPTLIVQHMPPVFTKHLAERLDCISPLDFFEGEHGQIVEPGCAYIAPGGKHMEIEKTGDILRIKLHEGRPENSCRPAVDTLFRSVAAIYGPKALAVILTGMGHDGLRGCEAIAEAGGTVYSQDQESSLIWGMPRAICEANLADRILSLDQIPGAIEARATSAALR